MKVYNTIQIYDIIIYCGLNQDSTISKCLIPDRCERKKTKKKNMQVCVLKNAQILCLV